MSLLASSAIANDGASPVDFARDVAPVLEGHCLTCHSAENRKGDISLATRADLFDLAYVVAGDPDGSDLIGLLTPEADGGTAPDAAEGRAPFGRPRSTPSAAGSPRARPGPRA